MSELVKPSRLQIPEIKPYESIAADTVITIINKAKDKLGLRMNLHELASTANYAFGGDKVCLKEVKIPLAITAEKFIADTIEKKWRLNDVFKYYLQYKGCSKDEVSKYYYYEAMFSQPTAEYPIPQATVSVFFRVEEKLISLHPGTPLMCFRIEGHHSDHDIRYVKLCPEWLLAVIQMKLKFFKRIEQLRVF